MLYKSTYPGEIEKAKIFPPIAVCGHLEFKGTSKNGKIERAIIYDRQKDLLLSLVINQDNEIRYENKKISLFDFERL